jgi:hypothetical protein
MKGIAIGPFQESLNVYMHIRQILGFHDDLNVNVST